jgi:hypothetical protein
MKNPLWNIVTAAIITTLLGCLGYLFTSISDLQKREASHDALEFTSKDAIILQQKLTDVMTDIDMRISLIERDIQWIKLIQPHPQPTNIIDTLPPSPPIPEVDAPPTETPSAEPDPRAQAPRYDLRRPSEQTSGK